MQSLRSSCLALVLLLAAPSAMWAQADPTVVLTYANGAPAVDYKGNATVYSGTLNLVLSLCTESTIVDTSVILYRAGGSWENVVLNDGALNRCEETSGSGYFIQLAGLLPGYNSLEVIAYNQSWDRVEEEFSFNYIPPYRAQVTNLASTMRITPGAVAMVPMRVTNTGANSSAFAITVSCTGPLTQCKKSGGTSSFQTATLSPGASVNLDMTATAQNYAGGGNLTVTARSVSSSEYPGAASAPISVIAPPTVPLAVTRGVTSQAAPASSTHPLRFTISNPDPLLTRAVSVAVFCNNGITCPISPTSYSVQPGKDTTVTVNATRPASTLPAGSYVRLTASSSSPTSSAKDSTFLTTGANPVFAGTVSVEGNPGTSIARDQCLSISLAVASGMECGALRVAHGFPGVRTMGVERAPALLYLSDHALGFSRIVAKVAVTYSSAMPSSMQATLAIVGQPAIPAKSFTWSPACNTEAGCRIVFPLMSTLPTGEYEYSLTIVPNVGSSMQTAGRLVIVNRNSSAFGGGWWLSGLEMLKPGTASTRMLWVGGDGSSRVFVRQNLPADTMYWIAEQPLNRIDSLHRTASGWERRLPNNARVEFDALLRHTKTVNRQGHVTRFGYQNSRAVPDSLHLPVPTGGTARFFQFTYTGSAGAERLSSIIAPNATGGAHATDVMVDADYRLTQIVAPFDSTVKDTVRFGYASSTSRLLTKRYSRMNDSATYAYDSAYTVISATAHSGSYEVSPVTTACAAEARSLTTCSIDGQVASALSYERSTTLVNGPRIGALDRTTFRIGRFGGPEVIIDPIGNWTRVKRGNGTFPALVTETQDIAGLVTKMSYNARGLPDTTRVVAPYETSDAVTRYTWHPKFDLITKVVGPMGEVDTLHYDSLGNRDWQQRGTETKRRVWFTYAPATHQLLKIRPDSFPVGKYAEQFIYEGELGNVWKTVSALGFTTELRQDAIGRDTVIWTPTDSAQTSSQRMKQIFALDHYGRVRKATTIGAAQSGTLNWQGESLSLAASADTSVVATLFDKEGRATRVTRYLPPDGTPFIVGETNFKYDRLGRLRSTRELWTNSKDSTVYDAAGNPTDTWTRKGDTIQTTYDVMGRPLTRTTSGRQFGKVPCMECHNFTQHPYGDTTKAPYYGSKTGPGVGSPYLIIPEEVVIYGYDLAGRMTQADNEQVKIRRGYYPNGALKVDTSYIHSYSAFSSGGLFTSKIAYSYDLSGRRVSRTDNLPNGASGTQAYTYDAVGLLASTTDSLQTGEKIAVTFQHDALGRLTSQSVPSASTAATWTYDLEGRPLTRTEEGFADVMRYDARGKKVAVVGQLMLAGGNQGAVLMAYDGRGQLVATINNDREHRTTARFELDAFGNVKVHEANPDEYELQNAKQLDSSTYLGSKLQSRVGKFFYPDTDVIDSMLVEYDNAGNVRHQQLIKRQLHNGTTNLRALSGHHWTWSFYDANNRLRYAQRTNYAASGKETVFEDFWYDALGRRVAVRTRADSVTCSPEERTGHCLQTYMRVVWDGDQILAEHRGDGDWSLEDVYVGTTGQIPWGTLAYEHYGQVRYVQTGAIDAPVAVWKDGEARVLHRNWRGNVAGATFMDAASTTGDTLDTSTVWPAAYTDAWFRPDANQTLPTPNRWLGSLVLDQRDATGTLYRRNRYYDPVSGRFTQEDPIGLAGGMNLYGYASGDPINNSDPFGLCAQTGASDTTTVEVCTAVADIPLNITGELHMWFRTNSKEAGLGNAEGGVPGEQGYYADNMPFLYPTAIVDHSGRGTRPGATCRAVNANASCVNDRLVIGQQRGNWGPRNQCQSLVREILRACGTPAPAPAVRPDNLRQPRSAARP